VEGGQGTTAPICNLHSFWGAKGIISKNIDNGPRLEEDLGTAWQIIITSNYLARGNYCGKIFYP
jgi:hypothetical protein